MNSGPERHRLGEKEPKTAFFDVSRVSDREASLRVLTTGESCIGKYVHDPQRFRLLPGTPFAYQQTEAILKQFDVWPRLSETGLETRQGLATADDVRFIRLTWEPNQGAVGWRGFAKGGTYSTFYADVSTAVNEKSGLRQMVANLNERGEVRSNIWMLSGTIDRYFGRPALRWTRTALGGRRRGFGLTALPDDHFFNDKSCCVFDPSDNGRELMVTLAILSSSVVDRLMRTISPTRSWEVGHVRSLPLVATWGDPSSSLAQLAGRGWSLRRSLDTCVEVSHAFVVPSVLQVEGGLFGDRVVGWAGRVVGVEAEVAGVQAEIDEVCFELYGISEEDRRAITEGFGVSGDSDDQRGEAHIDADEGPGVGLDPVGLAAGLVSWCVGVATGRFDVRLATGDRAWPVEPDPFDPLPVCSPAMLTGDDGLPLSEPPAGYPVDPSPVLVVDPGHRLDVTGRVRDVFDVVFGDEADVWWTEVGEVLDPRGGEIGSWLSKGFFEYHLKTHSKSRRKAPIVWPIGTSSGSYQVWLYAHQVSGDSLFRVLNDLIVPKLDVEESRLTRLRQEAGPNPSASERKNIDAQERFVSEMVDLSEMVEELAPLWAPDLNDGVVIVLAPLWRLFGFHKPWMRELKKHWGKLVKGDYDWAQLAMHLWPERVIPKCAHDRSLAIAHGLEDVFWEPDPDHDDKWILRDTPTIPIDQLIADRHSPTTQAALNTMDTT